MDKASNVKQTSKKSQMAIDKAKKSASKKKKKSKKSALTKSDQSLDQLEVEGVRALEQTGADSDCSSIHHNSGASPIPPRRPSLAGDAKNESAANTVKSTVTNNNISMGVKTNQSGSMQSSPVVVSNSAFIQHAFGTSVLNDKDSINRKVTVSFSNFNETQSVTNLSTMMVKSKNPSQRGRSKSSSKPSVNSVTKKENLKTKSCINKAAEEAARLRSEESLRWEYTLQDDVQEQERIRIYKINRRKRYLAAAQEKGLGWVVNYGINGSPVTDDSLMDLSDRECMRATVTDFSPVRSIRVSQSGNVGTEIAC